MTAIPTSAESAALGPDTEGNWVTRRPLMVVWFAVVIFSTGPVLVAGATAPGPVISFWRLWIGVPLLALAAFAERRHTRTPSTSLGRRITVLAGLAFGVHQLTLMSALRATSVVDVTLMNTLAPLVVALLAVPLFNERPGRTFRAWSLVAIAGAMIITLVGSTGPQGNPVGLALAGINVVFYALFFVCSKRARADIAPLSFLFGALVVAALVVSAFVFVAHDPLGEISAHDLWICLAIAAGPGIVGHFSMTWSLKWIPANIPPLIMLSIPALSGFMAWFFVGQSVRLGSIVGGAVTLVGVAGAIRSPGARALELEALEFAGES